MEINKHIIFYPLDSKFIKKCPTSAGVYMIRNILNGKSYIGSSDSIKRRLTNHLSHLNRNPKNFKPVVQYDLNGNFIAEYDSIMGAARSIHRDRSGIKDVCNGRQLSAYGYLWKFKQ